MDFRFFKKLAEHMHEGVFSVDPEGAIRFWNRSAERITGFSAQEVLSMTDGDLLHPTDAAMETEPPSCTATFCDHRVHFRHRNGHRIPVRLRVIPVDGADGKPAGSVRIFSDISKRHDIIRELEQLRNEILHDALTGVGNRKLADLKLTGLLDDFRRTASPFGLLFLDIDHFKEVNDRFGHLTGDRVLVMVARAMANAVRKVDVVARWGGEEFLVLIPGGTAPLLLDVAERIRKTVETTWLELSDRTIRVTVSIGGTSVEAEDSADSLIARADRQMYRSKSAGRNRIHIA